MKEIQHEGKIYTFEDVEAYTHIPEEYEYGEGGQAETADESVRILSERRLMHGGSFVLSFKGEPSITINEPEQVSRILSWIEEELAESSPPPVSGEAPPKL